MNDPDAWLRQHASTPEAIDLGLGRCQTVLAELDLNPAPYQVFTIAGTNGKGSCVAMLDAILSAAGCLTGRYSSPHLQTFNERIMLGQKSLENNEIIAAFEYIQAIAKNIKLTYFEYTTLAAQWLFAKHQVDVALLEVGLGGRLDAVNAMDADVAMITSIALDHQAWLGEDLMSIGYEKAGIMRANKPCIIAATDVPESVYIYAQSIQAKLILVEQDYAYQVTEVNNQSMWQWQDRSSTQSSMSSANSSKSINLPKPALSGSIQLQNAAGVIAAIKNSSLWPIDEEAIATGLSNIQLAGRSQLLSAHARQWLLDVAHNPAAMRALLENVIKSKEQVSSVVFSMLNDKDVDACVALLKPYINNWFICSLDSPRSYSVAELIQVLLKAGINEQSIHISDSVASACKAAEVNSLATERILVCGSFYLVGAAMDFLLES